MRYLICTVCRYLTYTGQVPELGTTARFELRFSVLRKDGRHRHKVRSRGFAAAYQQDTGTYQVSTYMYLYLLCYCQNTLFPFSFVIDGLRIITCLSSLSTKTFSQQGYFFFLCEHCLRTQKEGTSRSFFLPRLAANLIYLLTSMAGAPPP